VTTTIALVRINAQVVLAVCLIVALVIVGLVVLSSPVRTVVAHDVHTALSLAQTFVTAVSSPLSVIPHTPCGVSFGPC
jgi:hypothetical protein